MIPELLALHDFAVCAETGFTLTNTSYADLGGECPVHGDCPEVWWLVEFRGARDLLLALEQRTKEDCDV